MDTSVPREDSLNDLISAIYDCVIDPALWRDTVDRIRRRYGFHNGFLGVNNPESTRAILDVAVNISPEMLAVMYSQGAAVTEAWGGWARIAAAPLEEPTVNSNVRLANWAENAYYRLFASPQGIIDAVAIPLVREPHTLANIAFGVHRTTPPVTEEVLDELRILAPHLRRAVVIARLLETAMQAAASFAEALDAAAAGVVLVDRQRRVVHANRIAAGMLAAGDPIRVTAERQVELSTELVPNALRRAIETAEDAVAGSKGIGVPARRLNGEPLTVQVMPLERRAGSNTPLPAIAALFVAEAADGPHTSAEILAVLFDLTPAESRIFGLIVLGREVGDIATELGVALATVKTHLARVYHKTGETNRVGLVRLAQGVATPG